MIFAAQVRTTPSSLVGSALPTNCADTETQRRDRRGANTFGWHRKRITFLTQLRRAWYKWVAETFLRGSSTMANAERESQRAPGSRGSEWAIALGVFAASLAYFRLSLHLTLDLLDVG